LILATQETQCVGKSGGISPVKKNIDGYNVKWLKG
jgi:hypothetical protein